MEHGYVHVEKKGHGPAVVLLHGWGQNLYMMKFLQDHLQNQFTVFNLDLPGFGKSEEPLYCWSVDEICTVSLLFAGRRRCKESHSYCPFFWRKNCHMLCSTLSL